ncbi:MAG TPA: glycosyltransferase family 2 protein [Gaiellaceae bacterium]
MIVTLAPRLRGIEATGAWRAAAAAALATSLVAVEILIRSEAGLRGQIAGQLVAFAVYLPAAWLCWRGLGIGRTGVVLVLGVAVLLRVVAFDPGSPPPLTTDTYRYAWDARVQAAGVNPYRNPPAAPELEGLRDTEIWPNVNRKDWLTVYPPGAEASFLAARTAFGPDVRATTWLFLLAEGAALVLLLLVLVRLRAPPERVAVAAWHPLAVSEIAGNGHVDALALFAGAALLAGWATRSQGLAGVAVGFGALVKLGPLLLVPALARAGGRRFALGALATVAAGYALYSTAGRNVVGSLFRYLDREDLGSLAWWTLAPQLGRDGASVLLLLTVLAIVAVVSLRAHDGVEQVARTCLVVLGTLLLAAAFLQPWYALWLLPFLVVTAAPGWLWLTGTLPLLYTFGLEEGPLPGWVRIAIYVPFAVLSLAWLVRPRVRPRTAVPPLARPIRVAAVIPALDEAEALPRLLGEFPRATVDEIVVVDGGSRDGTPEAARAGGARVVVETRRGYGRACLTGLEATDAEIVVFLDGDGSDDPAAIPRLVAPILAGRAALVLGARTNPEPGAQHPHQRLGNRLVTLLVRACYQVDVRDIPPMRAVRRDTLLGLGMTELTYGWPTEMVVKAAREGVPLLEVTVPSRPRRGGRSKVSGRLGPSLKAGARMLAVVARYA